MILHKKNQKPVPYVKRIKLYEFLLSVSAVNKAIHFVFQSRTQRTSPYLPFTGLRTSITKWLFFFLYYPYPKKKRLNMGNWVLQKGDGGFHVLNIYHIFKAIFLFSRSYSWCKDTIIKVHLLKSFWTVKTSPLLKISTIYDGYKTKHMTKFTP